MRVDEGDIVAARGGDRPALERVLAHSRQDLRRYAEYHCAVNDIEDAVQETLILVSRKLHDLRAAEAFASWAFRIVKRECNRLKRIGRYLVLQEIPEEIEDPHSPPASELTRDVARVLAMLPVHYRDIILMRDLEGLSIAEIGARVGLQKEATKARLHRARSLARQYLDPNAPASCAAAPRLPA